ncbi:unnamed protein product [Pocillopora meandrina]|uniref:Uncharacterized protein n=1 Tax=Pocillopora meandrina TaxID=46732 RepID=A0AAU9VIK7_9CNID|nr:unnamed protein product [Pocillopora meandrina]
MVAGRLRTAKIAQTTRPYPFRICTGFRCDILHCTNAAEMFQRQKEAKCVCQVTILFSDVTESWNGFSVQGKDSCNVFRVLSLFMTFFQTGNLTAILTVYHEHSVGYENRDLNSNLRMFAVLILGFAGSLMIWWHNCFAKAAVSQAALEVALFLTMLLIFLLLVVALVKNNDEDNLKTTSPESDMATHSCSLLWKCIDTQASLFDTTSLPGL